MEIHTRKKKKKITVDTYIPGYNYFTIEEIALVLQYLANLVHPDLTDSRTH